jgi:hypothetical protein
VTTRGKSLLGAVGCGLAALALLSFVLRVTQKVFSGHALDTYYSAKLIQWNYGSSFITILLVVMAGLVVGTIKLIQRLEARKAARDSRSNPTMPQ